jgi:cytochrome c peroxidase
MLASKSWLWAVNQDDAWKGRAKALGAQRKGPKMNWKETYVSKLKQVRTVTLAQRFSMAHFAADLPSLSAVHLRQVQSHR